MIAFRDRKGRLWTGRLDVDAAIRLRDLAGTDVMDLALDSNAARQLATEPARLVDAAFALVLPQCGARGVSDREFGRCLWGRFWGGSLTPSDLAEMLFAEVGEFFAVPELSPGQSKSDGPQEQPTAAGLWGALWRCASLVGIEPGPRTFGELIAAADAKRKHDWAQTASLLAWIENNAMGRKTRVSPADRDPTGGLGASRSTKLPVTPENFSLVATLLMGSRN